MKKITEYMNYLSSIIFGATMVFIFVTDMSLEEVRWGIAFSLALVWFFPLVRIGYLSDKLKSAKCEPLTHSE